MHRFTNYQNNFCRTLQKQISGVFSFRIFGHEMDPDLCTLIERGDLDQLGSFFEENRDYAETNSLFIDESVVKTENVDIISLFLSNGAELHPSAIFTAIRKKEIVEVLIAAGADVNKPNDRVSLFPEKFVTEKFWQARIFPVKNALIAFFTKRRLFLLIQ